MLACLILMYYYGIKVSHRQVLHFAFMFTRPIKDKNIHIFLILFLYYPRVYKI